MFLQCHCGRNLASKDYDDDSESASIRQILEHDDHLQNVHTEESTKAGVLKEDTGFENPCHLQSISHVVDDTGDAGVCHENGPGESNVEVQTSTVATASPSASLPQPEDISQTEASTLLEKPPGPSKSATGVASKRHTPKNSRRKDPTHERPSSKKLQRQERASAADEQKKRVPTSRLAQLRQQREELEKKTEEVKKEVEKMVAGGGCKALSDFKASGKSWDEVRGTTPGSGRIR
mmetsp:Transcript_71262/g.126962  ORF Transcript_71262/g.126962 Transcript_71262/m.126962 type:complete len:235 (-) Transcript_71262:177-881(-)